MAATVRNLSWELDAEGRLEECERLVRVNLELAERAVRAWRAEQKRIDAERAAARQAREMGVEPPIAFGSAAVAHGQHNVARTRWSCAWELSLALTLPWKHGEDFDAWVATVPDAV